mgnify:CR=1 FL=1
MNKVLSKYYKENLILWISFFFIWVIGLAYSFTGSQVATHIELNSFHTPFLDTFFKLITEFGGNLPFILIGIFMLFNLRDGFFLLLGQGICSLITQIFKYTMAHPRPYTLFKSLGIDLPPTVEGVELWNAFNSFPSGHTSCVFVFLAGIAAIFWSSSFVTVASATGNGMELDAIAGVYIGGTSAAGGVASVGGSVIGAAMLVVIRSGLNFVLAKYNVSVNSTYVTYVLTGVIVVFSVLIDILKNKKKK